MTLILAALFVITACNKNEKESESTPSEETPVGKKVTIDVVLKDLRFPWGLAYLPNGDLLFTERPGRLNIHKKGEASHKKLADRQVPQNSEGGLLGVAVDPEFSSNHYIYIYETAATNQVVRFRLENDAVSDEKVIVGSIPKNQNHNGGVIRFGPDGFLYIGTGDAQQTDLSQNLASLAGKILRVDRDGNPAPGNPFGTPVWSYGHRNVQGLAWGRNNAMYASEHGPSGDLGWCCHDEVNLIQKSANYGWPMVHAGNEKDSLTAPLAHSGNDTWAPSGCEYTGDLPFWENSLLVCCLRGQKLIRFRLDGGGTAITSQSDTLDGTFDRLRNIIRGPEGSLVFCTSNGDDQILKISFR